MRRLARASVGALLMVVLLPLVGPASAQQQQEPNRGTVRLLGQTTWLQADQPFELRLAVATQEPAESLEVAVTVFRRVTTRSEFAQTTQNRLRSSVVGLTRTPLSQLDLDESGAGLLSITPQLGRDGVYPVRVELRERGGGRVLDTFTTHLIHLPSTFEGDKLRVAMVLPFEAPPAVQPDGTTQIDQGRAAALSVLVKAIGSRPDVPLVVQPRGETLDGLSASGREQDKATLDGLTQIVRSQRQVVAGHYTDASLTALLRAGLVGEAVSQLNRNIGTVERVLGDRPDTRTWVADGRLDETAVERLRDQQVDRIVIPEPAMEPLGRATTLTEPFELEVRSRRMKAVASDPGLAAHFATAAEEPVLSAHRLLADLSVLYLDRPGRPRASVVVPPAQWVPEGTFVAAVLAGLGSSPILQGATLDTVFDRVPAATAGRGPVVRRVAPGSDNVADLPGSTIRDLRRRLDAFNTILDPANPLYDRMERTLLAAQSSSLRSRQRSSYLDGVQGQVDREIRALRVASDRTITLTAREGELPVTIRHTSSYPVRVVLRLDSDSLLFPDGDRRVIELARPNATERFKVRARASGSFPLRVRLESPDGELVLAESRFTVRSTAASGVGVALSVGAALFLLVWWARHVHSRQRSKRLVPS